MSWGSDSNANRFKKSYIQGFLDVSGGNLIVESSSQIQVMSSQYTGQAALLIKPDRFSVFTGQSSYDISYVTFAALGFLGVSYQYTTADIYNRIQFIGSNTLTENVTFIGSDSSVSDLIVYGNISTQNNGNITGARHFFLTGDASLNQKLYVAGNANMNSNVAITLDLSVNQNVFVTGRSSFTNDVSMNRNVDIGTGNNSVAINKDISENVALDVSGSTVLRGPLSITGDTSFNRSLQIGSDLSINRFLYVNNNALFNTDVSINQNLYVSGRASIGRPPANTTYELDVSGQMRIYEPSGTLATATSGSLVLQHGDASGVSSIVFRSTNDSGSDYAYIQYQENVGGGGATQKGLFTIGIENESGSGVTADRISLYAAGGSGFVGVNTKDPLFNLDVSGNARITGTVAASLDVSLNRNVKLGTSSNSVAINKDISSSFALDVSGITNLRAPLYTLSDVSMNGKLFASLDASFNQNLSVGQDVSINRSLYVVNRALFSSDVSINGFTKHDNSVSINKDISSSFALDVSGITVLRAPLYTLSDVSINGKLFASLDASLNQNLSIGEDVSINRSLYVVNRALFSNDVSLNRNVKLGTGSNSIAVNKDISSSFALDVSGTTVLRGQLSTLSDVSINGKLSVSGDISLNGNVAIGEIQTIGIGLKQPPAPMTANVTNIPGHGSYYAYTSSFSDIATQNPYILFDDNINTFYYPASYYTNVQGDPSINVWAGTDTISDVTSTAYPGYRFHLDLPYQINLSRFDYRSGHSNRYPVQGSMLGSNDGTSWYHLYSFDLSGTYNNASSQTGISDFSNNLLSNNSFYSKYALVIKSMSKASRFVMYEIKLFGNNKILSTQGIGTTSLGVSDNLTVGSTANLYGNVTIGSIDNAYNRTGAAKLLIMEPTGTVASATSGSLVLQHGDASGASSIVFRSTNDSGSDYAYIQYKENVGGGGATQKGLFTIGIENESGSGATADRMSLYAAGGSGFVGVNTLDPQSHFDVSGNARITGTVTASLDVSLNKNVKLGTSNNSVAINKDISSSFALDVSGITVLRGPLYALSDVSLGQKLFLSLDASFNQNLSIGQDVSINRSLYVQNRALFSNDVSINGFTKLNNSVAINKDISSSFALDVSGITALRGPLYTLSDVYLSQKLFVSLDASFNQNLLVGQDLSVNRFLYINNNSLFNGDVSTNQNLYVSGKATFGRPPTNTTYELDVSGQMRIYEAVGSNVTTSSSVGTLTLQHGDASGCSSIMFTSPSTTSNGDYAYIKYQDLSGTTTTTNAGLLTIGIENDTTSVGTRDRISLYAAGGSGFVGVNTLDPSFNLDVSGNVNVSRTLITNTIDVSNSASNMDIAVNQISGTLNIGTDPSRNGTINIGTGVNVGRAINIGTTGTGFLPAIRIGNFDVCGNSIRARSNQITAVFSSYNTTGGLRIGESMTSGTHQYSFNQSSGFVQIAGSTRNSGSIEMGCGNNNALHTMSIGTGQTNAGLLNIANGALSTGNVNIMDGSGSTGTTIIGRDNAIRIVNNLTTTVDISASDQLTLRGSTVRVFGSSLFNSDVSLNQNVKLGSGNNSIAVNKDISSSFALDVSGITVLRGPLYALSDVSFSQKLFVSLDASFNQSLLVGQDVSINRSLYVVNRALFSSDVSINGFTKHNNSVSINKDISSSFALDVSGITNLRGPLYTLSDVSFSQKLFVAQDASFNQSLSIGEDVSINRSLYVQQRALFSNDVSLNRNVKLGRGSNSIAVNKDISSNFALDVSGTTVLRGQLSTLSDVSINGKLSVSGDISLNGNVAIGEIQTIGIGLKQPPQPMTANVTNIPGHGSYYAYTSSLSTNDNIPYKVFDNSSGSVCNSGSAYTTPVGDPSINVWAGTDTISDVTSTAYPGYRFHLDLPYQINLSSFTYTAGIGRYPVQGTMLGSNNGTSWYNIYSFDLSATLNNHTTQTGNLTFPNNLTSNTSFYSKYALVTRSIGCPTFPGSRFTMKEIQLFGNNKILSTQGIGTTSLGVSDNLTVGSTANFLGNVTIGNIENAYNRTGAAKLLIMEPTGTVASATSGSLVLQHGDASGVSSIVFRSTNDSGSDYAYIQYKENVGGGATQKGLFTIGIENDSGSGATADRMSLYAAGGSGFVGVNTLDPQSHFDVSGNARISGTVTASLDVSLNRNVKLGTGNNSVAINKDISSSFALDVSGITNFRAPLYALSDVSLGQKLFLSLDASFNQNLSVGEDVSINRSLYVQQRALFSSDVSINGFTKHNNSVSINKDISSSLALDVSGITVLRGPLYTLSDVSINGKLFVSLDASFNQSLSVGQDLSVNRFLYINNNSLFNGDVSTNQNLYVSGKATFGRPPTNTSYEVDLSGQMRIYEASGSNVTTASSVATLTLEHGDASGCSSIMFTSPSTLTNGDYAYIKYQDLSGTTTTNAGLLTIGIENDTTSVGTRDRISLYAAGGSGFVGVNTLDPSFNLDVSGNVNVSNTLFTNNIEPSSATSALNIASTQTSGIINIGVNTATARTGAINLGTGGQSGHSTALNWGTSSNSGQLDFKGGTFNFASSGNLTFNSSYGPLTANIITGARNGGVFNLGTGDPNGAPTNAFSGNATNNSLLNIATGSRTAGSDINIANNTSSAETLSIGTGPGRTGDINIGTGNTGTKTIGLGGSLTTVNVVGRSVTFASDVSLNGNTRLGTGSNSIAVNKDISSSFALDVSGQLRILEGAGTSASPSTGSLILEHTAVGGTSSIMFKGPNSTTSDYAYVQYTDASSVIQSLLKYDLSSGNHGQFLGNTNFTSTGTNPEVLLGTAPIDNSFAWIQGTSINGITPAVCISFNQTNLNLTNTTSRINYLQTNSFSSMSSFTFSAWIRPGQITASDAVGNSLAWMIANLTNNNANGCVDIWLENNGRIYALLGDDGDNYIATNSALDINTWYHLVFTFDGNLRNGFLYLNGQLNTAIGGSGLNGKALEQNNNLIIGMKWGWNTGAGYNQVYSPTNKFKGFRGQMAFVNVFDRGISASDVDYLYNNPAYNLTTNSHRGLMTIGIENETGTINNDRIVLWPGAGSGSVGVNTRTPRSTIDISGTLNVSSTITSNNGTVVISGQSGAVLRLANQSPIYNSGETLLDFYGGEAWRRLGGIGCKDRSAGFNGGYGSSTSFYTTAGTTYNLEAMRITGKSADVADCASVQVFGDISAQKLLIFSSSLSTSQTLLSLMNLIPGNFPSQINIDFYVSNYTNYLPGRIACNQLIAGGIWYSSLSYFVQYDGTSLCGMTLTARSTNTVDVSINGIFRTNNAENNKKFVLWDDPTSDLNSLNSTTFYGFGINSNALRYQTNSTGSHKFFSGDASGSIGCGKILMSESGAGTSAVAAGGSLTLQHQTNGASSIVFRSASNAGSDYGYIQYEDNFTTTNYTGTSEHGLLTIGVENETGGGNDRICLWACGGAGNVGINTKNPLYTLDVSGSLMVASDMYMNNGKIMYAKSTTGSWEGFLWPRWTDDITHLNYGGGGFLIRNNSSNSIMFMKPNGSIGINTTNPNDSYKLDVSGNTLLSGTAVVGSNCQIYSNSNNVFVQNTNNLGWLYLQSNVSGTTTTNKGIMIDKDGNVGIKVGPNASYSLAVNGNVNAVSYNASSDYRIKENVMPLDLTFNVDVLKPVSYVLKDDKDAKLQIGFIAHEVQEFYPFLVNGVKDGSFNQSINYNGFIGILTKEIQVLKKKVSDQEERLASQEAKALEQEERLQALEKMLLNK